MVAANYEVFDVTCRYCGITYQILADREDLDSWMNGSGYIQDILGYLSAAERELLISGTCDNCCKNIFSQDFDVDDDEE